MDNATPTPFRALYRARYGGVARAAGQRSEAVIVPVSPPPRPTAAAARPAITMILVQAL
jgi:hypothetical protein